jgi:protein TonB
MRLLVALLGLPTVFSLIAAAQTPPPLLARPLDEQPTHRVAVEVPKNSKNIISCPAPQYPAAALRRHITGSGVFEGKISKSGEVESVAVVKSTGYSILDDAVISAMRNWRFRPTAGMVGVRVPITFSIPKTSRASAKKT